MIRNKIHKFISMFAVLVVFSGCENQTSPEIQTNLNSENISKTVWLSIDKNGNPKIDDYQKCKLFFKNKQEYEIRKTFVYSESTFRNPGEYEVRDSVIKLKSFDGTEHLGNLYVLHDNKLRLEWNKSSCFGEGTEIFVNKNR